MLVAVGDVIHQTAEGQLITTLEIIFGKQNGSFSSLLLSPEQVSLATDGTFSSFLANRANQLLTVVSCLAL